jgi:hypothetical protein
LIEDLYPLLLSQLTFKLTTAAAAATTATFPTTAALLTTACASIGAQTAKTAHWKESYIVFD